MDRQNPDVGAGPNMPIAPGAWASWVNVVLGVWEAASPWIIGYAAMSQTAADNALGVGAVTFVSGLYAALTWYVWPSWINALAGAWLIMSPFILGFRHVTPYASLNDYIVGGLILVLALIAGFSKPQVMLPE